MGTTAPLPRVNADFLVRPRLLEVLDQWSPITLLLAPSGAGKTVLAVQWAAYTREGGDDVIWLDGEVDDPAAVVGALARHAGDQVEADVETTLRRLRRGLRGLDRRLAVVINNAEPIIESIGDALVEIVRDCREVHLVICLRRRLAPVAKALLEAETRVVGLSDLQFTAPEIQALAQKHGLSLASDEAESIRTSVGGWPALVRTGLEPLPDTGPRSVAIWSPRHVGWFLGVNVVPALPPTALAALCRSALVEHPTYGAVLAATGPLDDPARIALEHLGILDPLVSEGEPIVRLPPLMRDFFRGRYDERELGPEVEVHQRVARLWLDAQEPRLALAQAVHGRCWALAVEIVERHWWAVVDAELLEIPATEVRGHPRAEIARQVMLPDDPTPSSPAVRAWEAELRSASAEDLVDRAGEPDVLALLTLLMVRDRGRGDQRSALDLAQRVETVVGPSGLEVGAVPPPVARAALEAGRTRLLAGDVIAATRMLRVADGAADELAMCAAITGDRHATALWVERSSGAGGRIAAALDALHSLDQERSANALARLRADGMIREQLWPFAAWAAAEHALLWGGRSVVRAELAATRGATSRRREGGWLQGLLVAAEADLCISLGRTAVAARLLAETDVDHVHVLLARARLERVVGRPGEALGLLDVVVAAGDPSALVGLESLVLRAWCLDETGTGAADVLDQALQRARQDRLVLPFTHVPVSLLDRHARTVPGLGRLADRLRDARIRSPYDVVDELPALTPRESAVLEALARGLSLEEVARELFVSRNTVKTQAASLYRKLRVSGRADAVHKATAMGLLD
jgi:LuxR family maltose regulon positive regulatory protein